MENLWLELKFDPVVVGNNAFRSLPFVITWLVNVIVISVSMQTNKMIDIFVLRSLELTQILIVNPVREALDYYRKLNEASKENRVRRSVDQGVSPLAPSSSLDVPDVVDSITEDDKRSISAVSQPDENK